MFYVLEPLLIRDSVYFFLWNPIFYCGELLCYFYNNKLSKFFSFIMMIFFINKQEKLYYVRGNRVQGVPFPYSLYYMMNLLFLVLDFTKL